MTRINSYVNKFYYYFFNANKILKIINLVYKIIINVTVFFYNKQYTADLINRLKLNAFSAIKDTDNKQRLAKNMI